MHNDDSRLEDELRLSLRRVEAPGEFAAGVLSRVERERDQARGQLAGSRRPRYVTNAVRALLRSRVPGLTISPSLAAALMLMLLLPLGNYVYRRHREAQAEVAARQFVLAMRLTQAALQDAAEHVQAHAHGGNTE